MEILLRLLARNESTISSNSTLINDISDNVTSSVLEISRNTVADYLDVLNKLHIIENQPSYMYKIRLKPNVGKKYKKTWWNLYITNYSIKKLIMWKLDNKNNWNYTVKKYIIKKN